MLSRHSVGAVVTRRNVATTVQLCKTIPSNLKGKSVSSKDWITRQLNDPYVKMARYKNYRARSAFKLIEIDDKHKILRPGMTVVECGAAPGAWTQVLVERLDIGQNNTSKCVRGKVIAVDINPFSPVEGAHIITKADFTKPINQAKVLSLLDGNEVDVVCSDMAPNASGVKTLDHDNQISLVYSALRFALPVLKPNTGVFLAKIWEGGSTKELTDLIDKFFGEMVIIKPHASRLESSEVFVLAKYFRGIKQ